MKTSRLFLFICILALSATSLFAQRETFDATVTRKAEVIVVDLIKQPIANGINRIGVDENGRRIDLLASREAVVFANIYFKLDTAELRDEASALQVAEIATAMKSPKLKNARFLIEGHTCDLGEEDYNMQLSAQRAATIRRLLIKHGIEAERLAVLGFGESELVERVTAKDTPAKAEAKRMKSRRVVLRRLLPLPTLKK